MNAMNMSEKEKGEAAEPPADGLAGVPVEEFSSAAGGEGRGEPRSGLCCE